jgi:hypothetical protein
MDCCTNQAACFLKLKKIKSESALQISTLLSIPFWKSEDEVKLQYLLSMLLQPCSQ